MKNLQCDSIECLFNIKPSLVSAAKPNLINFGDCFVNEPRTLTFSLTNHSKTDSVRFVWPEHPQLKFSPTVGHIHPGRSKDLTVTFKTDTPKSLNEHEVLCKITKITFVGDMPGEWDDRLRTVRWVDIAPPPEAASDRYFLAQLKAFRVKSTNL